MPQVLLDGAVKVVVQRLRQYRGRYRSIEVIRQGTALFITLRLMINSQSLNHVADFNQIGFQLRLKFHAHCVQ
jgi:hypothetical protein